MNKIALLIAAGALASIATSKQPTRWSFADEVELAPTTIDNAHPVARYRIRAERHGQAAFQSTGFGYAGARVVVTNAQPTPKAVVTLRSITHPDHMPETLSTPANQFDRYLSLEPWLACEADPCVEEFELVIERDPAGDAPPFDIGGSATTSFEGDRDEPTGVSVVVTVTGPLP